MVKDFAKSYEQICWENAVNSHAKLSNLLVRLTTPSLIMKTQEEVTKLEKKYPQLKKN